MRQGNDVGTQYRSAIYTTTPAQREAAERVARDLPGGARRGAATARSPPRSPTAGPFYYAEDYHQQYLAKNPNGYCGLGGTGVSCPIGTGVLGRLRGGTSAPPREHSTSCARRRSRVSSRFALVTQWTAARRYPGGARGEVRARRLVGRERACVLGRQLRGRSRSNE